jgi:hypothetical protein
MTREEVEAILDTIELQKQMSFYKAPDTGFRHFLIRRFKDDQDTGSVICYLVKGEGKRGFEFPLSSSEEEIRALVKKEANQLALDIPD